MSRIIATKRLIMLGILILMGFSTVILGAIMLDRVRHDSNDYQPYFNSSQFKNKLDPLLMNLLYSHVDPTSNKMQVHDSFHVINIPITIRVTDSPDPTIRFIKSLGGVTGLSGEGYLEASVPFKLIRLLSERESVLGMSLIQVPQLMESKREPISAMIGRWSRSFFWNQAEYKGASVKVGILDGGFLGISELMGNELSDVIHSRCYTSIFEYSENAINDCEKTTNHGTSVAEIIFDVAPEASIYISNPRTPAALRDAVEWMVSNEVDVINHSMGWPWDGSGDGTSPRFDSPLNSVDFAVENGIVWVNGVGNEAKSTWFGKYSDSDNDSLLNFDVNSNSNFIQLNQQRTTTIQLRWADSWSRAESDLNFYLYPFGESISESVAWSTSVQSGSEGQIPLEMIAYKPEKSGRFSFSVQGKSGPFPEWVQVQAYTSENLGIYSQGFSISNPAESKNEGLIAVGAADVNSLFDINPNSGRGPTTDGRVKPDLVGPDGLQTNSRGIWSGSSQSSAYVTGLIALVRQRYPEFSPTEVTRYLKNSADPRGQNPNNTWGHGFVRLPFLEPSSPVELSVTIESNGRYISWSKPGFNGGASITGYLLVGDLYEKSITVPPEVTSFSIGSLNVEKIYKIEVYAINEHGKSPPATIFLEEREDGTIKSSVQSTENQSLDVLGLGLPPVGDNYFARLSKWIFLVGASLIILGARFIFVGSRKTHLF